MVRMGRRANTAGFLTVLLFAFLLEGAAAPGPIKLVDRYRTGRIVLRADEDWTSNLPSDLVFESRGSIAVAPDGSVFVSNSTRHAIFKFDAAVVDRIISHLKLTFVADRPPLPQAALQELPWEADPPAGYFPDPPAEYVP
jgi:hypothetical protein